VAFIDANRDDVVEVGSGSSHLPGPAGGPEHLLRRQDPATLDLRDQLGVATSTRRQPWKTVEDVELAPLGWVQWHNTRRLHGYLADRTPTEYEEAFYAAHRDDQIMAGIP
jgi:hypothetical protein